MCKYAQASKKDYIRKWLDYVQVNVFARVAMVTGSFVILAPAVTWPRSAFDMVNMILDLVKTSEIGRFLYSQGTECFTAELPRPQLQRLQDNPLRWLDMSSLSMKWKAMAHSSKLLLIKFLKMQCFEIQDERVPTSASVLEDEIDKTVTMLYRMDTWSIKRCALTVSSTCHTSHFEPDQVASWAMLWWGKCLKLGLWAT